MEKQTAVEWLEEKWLKYDLNLGKSGFSLLLKQAQEKEKEQLVIFGAECVVQAESGLGTIGIYENYYSKKFK